MKVTHLEQLILIGFPSNYSKTLLSLEATYQSLLAYFVWTVDFILYN